MLVSIRHTILGYTAGRDDRGDGGNQMKLSNQVQSG